MNTFDIWKYRTPAHEVDSRFPQRWSPRAMNGEPIEKEELMSLFEAARWAPSSMNNQPWRFLYTMKGSPAWDTFYGLLAPGNRAWAQHAAALIVVISKNTFDFNGKPARTHSYDTGAAWMSLALQGSFMGLVVHGMQGFDYDKAKSALNIPDEYTVEAMAAVGRPGPIENIPADRRDEEHPNGRKEVDEFVFEDGFPSE